MAMLPRAKVKQRRSWLAYSSTSNWQFQACRRNLCFILCATGMLFLRSFSWIRRADDLDVYFNFCSLPGPCLHWKKQSLVSAVSARCLSQQSAAQVLGVSPGASQDDLRRAFRSRARAAHPDGGGSVEAFRHLREAYAYLRRGEGAKYADVDKPSRSIRALDQEWAAWEEEVRSFQELADEGDVLYWRPGKSESWSPAVVLAVQVVYEPSSGPHGWIYLQPLIEESPGGPFIQDEEAEMEQVEPLSSDGVDWCFARSAQALGEGRWNLGPQPYLPQ